MATEIKVPFLFVLVALLTNCTSPPVPVPKPRAYPRVEYPEKEYRDFREPYCELTFRYPAYAQIEQDTLYFDEKPANDCWFTIRVPELNGSIHCSYYPVTGPKSLDKLRNDAFKLADKHQIKADYIDELPIERPDGTTGMVFDIQGPVASPFQFFLTDGQEHFLRGSLYFNTQARPDSLAPISEFLKADVMELINTLKWSDLEAY